MTPQHGHHDHGDTTGVHGMLLFGEAVPYLSHFGMFNHLHGFQALAEADFDDDVRAILKALHAGPGGEMTTFVPEPFPIVELDGPVRTTLRGTIFRGHFERGGTPVTGKVTAKIENTVDFHPFDLTVRHDDAGVLTYLCFGRPGELYLAHNITARPDFDHIVAVRLVPGTIRDQAGRPLSDDDTQRTFAQAAPIRFSGRTDTPGARLAPGETVEGLFFQTMSHAGAHGFRAEIEILHEIYLEIGELG